MKLAVDLHIHSGLSPCSEEEMSPNNIISMAKLKGLDAIAITDHNSTRNLSVFSKVAKKHNLLFIPGVEITTKEEVHLIALFNDLTGAIEFQNLLDRQLPPILNNKKVFGPQLIYNEFDEIIDEFNYLLTNAINLSVYEVIKVIKELNGIVIPAHINRGSFSILSNLGFISPDLGVTTIEITQSCDYSLLEKKHPSLKEYTKIINSDAHNLGNILERESYLEVKEPSVSAILSILGKK